MSQSPPTLRPPVLRLDLLGPPRLTVDGDPVEVETRKALAVLARVLVEGPQRRDTLDALLWPSSDGPRARAALRRTLTAVRRALPHDVLAPGDDVALRAAVATDLADVETLVDGTAPDVADLARADRLHRGEFLAGLLFRDADPFEDWRRDTAQYLARRHARILERLCTARVRAGALPEAIEAARRRLALDPLHEPSHQQLMLLHAWTGDRSAAARQYDECVRVLDEELGVAPLPKTVALDRAVRTDTLDPPPRAPGTSAGGRGGPDDGRDDRGDDGGDDGAAAARGRSGQAAPRPSTVVPLAAAAESLTATGPASLPFVGRDEQRQLLMDRHAACGSDGAVAVVVGEAGIGKSRLVEEVAADVHERGGHVVRLVAHRGEAALSYAPVTAALRSAGGRLSDLEPAVRTELARLVPDVVGLATPSTTLTTPAARTLLVDACATALTTLVVGGDAPGLIVVDDLDVADDETRELVAYLARRRAGRGLLLLATSRESVVVPGVDVHLDLPRLAVADVRALVEASGVGGSGGEEVVARLRAESEGVPFLVVSYLAALAEGEEGWGLPRDARDVVRSRLGRLDEVARQVLGAAAILGGTPTLEVLARVSGRGDDEVVDAVEALVVAGLLVIDADGTCALTHDKVRVVVVDDTSHVRRRLLHRRAAEVLATRPHETPAAMLAWHLRAAGREEEAAAAHAEAGQAAAALYANEAAIDHLDAALALGHPDAGALLVALGDLLVRTGRYGPAAASYTRAAVHAAATATVEERLGALAARRGDDAAAEAHLARALAADPDPAQRAAVLAVTARVQARRGDLDAAAASAGAAIDVAVQHAEPALVAVAHDVAGLVARRTGDLDAARRFLQASLAAATDVEQRAAALNNLALVCGEAGDLDEALDLARTALEVGRTAGDRHHEAALLNNLADLLHAAGRTDEALDLQARAAERFAGVGDDATSSPEIWRLVDW